MSMLYALSAAGGASSLAERLYDVAHMARRAATFADGEYIPQMSRVQELKRSWNDASRAVSALERLKPEIAALDAGEDGVRLAERALEQLRSGRQALVDGVRIEDDVLRGGSPVVDVLSTSVAGRSFEAASDGVRGIADLAKLETMGVDDVLRGLLGR